MDQKKKKTEKKAEIRQDAGRTADDEKTLTFERIDELMRENQRLKEENDRLKEQLMDLRGDMARGGSGWNG